jgi:hypothetical protein
MSKYAESLKFSLYLNFKSIVPNHGSLIKVPYKTAKSKLKKITKQINTIDQIDEIIIVLTKISLQEYTKSLNSIDLDGTIEIFKQHIDVIKPEIETILSKSITDNEYIKIVILLAGYMRISNEDCRYLFKNPSFINTHTNC